MIWYQHNMDKFKLEYSKNSNLHNFWLFIIINISLISNFNTYGQSVRGRNSITCNPRHSEVHLKYHHFDYVEFQYVNHSNKEWCCIKGILQVLYFSFLMQVLMKTALL